MSSDRWFRIYANFTSIGWHTNESRGLSRRCPTNGFREKIVVLLDLSRHADSSATGRPRLFHCPPGHPAGGIDGRRDNAGGRMAGALWVYNLCLTIWVSPSVGIVSSAQSPTLGRTKTARAGWGASVEMTSVQIGRRWAATRTSCVASSILLSSEPVGRSGERMFDSVRHRAL